MTPELLPIGTEYWGPGSVDIHSTDNFARRFKYKVIAHDKAVFSRNPKAPTVPIATIKPLAEQHADIISYNIKTGEHILGEWYDA